MKISIIQFLVLILLFNFWNIFTQDKIKKTKIVHKEIVNNTIICNIKHPKNGIIKLSVIYEDSNYVRLIITDDLKSRFVLPNEEPFPFARPRNISSYGYIENVNYQVIIKDNPLSIGIVLRSTGENIFLLDTNKYPFIFDEHYLDFTLEVPSNYIYGFGERSADFQLKEGTYTLYNRDQYGVEEDGKGGKNLYGSHPMYLNRDKKGNYHVNFLRNSLPMDVILGKNNNQTLLNYKIVGGIIDFHFFVGNKNPDTSVKLYHSFLGGFELPPFWSMGWQQSRWGYRSKSEVEEVLSGYEKNKLPLDVIWLDIDYMIDKVQFTLDENRYNRESFNKMLKDYKKKFVLIMEPSMAIKTDPNGYLSEGRNNGYFIKKGNSEDYLTNVVWPGECHFIDYFNPDVKDYWHKMLRKFHKVLDYNGVWLDMNEIATFYPWENCEDPIQYPYLPGNVRFNENTICQNGRHYGNIQHINLHNYYPNQQARVTNSYLRDKFPDEYPFILSRANGPGLGKYSIHWTGDNLSKYKFLKYSLSTIFTSGISGIAMTGADICGFGGVDPTEELCARWMQIGTLYPFARSHSHESFRKKEPWRFGEIMLKTSEVSIKLRYKLLKFYYSLFIRSKKTGLLFRPLFFEFSDDKSILDSEKVLNSQFLIGSELMVTPSFEDGSTYEVYFPKGSWYDLRNDSKQIEGIHIVTSNFKEIAPIYLREGKSIFMQNVENVMNVYDLNDNFEILIALRQNEKHENIYLSEGYIPALNNYNNKHHVENCIFKDCQIKVASIYDTSSLELKIYFSKANYIENDYKSLRIFRIKVYGVNEANKLNLKSSSKFLNTKFTFKAVNEQTINIEIEINPLELPGNKETELIFSFY